MAALEMPFVPLSARYGFRPHLRAWGREHSEARHSGTGYGAWGNCQRDEKLRCACPGGSTKPCCDTATQEDFLCNACREHCFAVDPQGGRHRFIDLYGPARGNPKFT